MSHSTERMLAKMQGLPTTEDTVDPADPVSSELETAPFPPVAKPEPSKNQNQMQQLLDMCLSPPARKPTPGSNS